MKKGAIWPLTTLIFAIGIAFFSARLPLNWWVLPWAVSLVLFGLPHGAIDHEVVLKLWQPQPPPKWALWAVLAGYLAISLVILLSWFLIPSVVFFGFILLTVVHWGLADLWWSWNREPAYFGSRIHRCLFALLRGTIPMLVPLCVDASVFREIAEKTCGLFLKKAPNFGWLELSTTHSIAWGLIFALVSLDGILGKDVGRSRLLNAAETLSLLLFFGLLSPLVSIGFYFAFWHGLRHILRLKSFQNLSWRTFALHSLPATLGALLLLLGLSSVTKRPLEITEVLGIYLALIAALTVPHALVVYGMDKRIKLWKN